MNSPRRAAGGRWRWLTLLAGAFLVLLAGCGRRETAAAAGIRTQTLLLGNYAEPADLDPQLVNAYTDFDVCNALFEGLTWIDEKSGRPVPAAAERWEVSAGGRVYIFHLRVNGRWSNGDPVTSRDFAYSFRRILLPSLGVQYAYMLWPIKNARAFNAGRLADFSRVGVEALDDTTLRITLEKPTPYLPALAAHNTWMPVHRATLEKFGRIDQRGTRWTRPGNLVGNGPFTLEEWTPNSRIVTVKNRWYWDADRVRLKRIIFFPIENAETEELNFRAGQLHATFDLPISKVASYRARDPLRLRIDPWLSTIYLIFNVTRPPLDNGKLRRALALAIDREALARDVLSGTRRPARSLTPPGCAGYTARAQVPDDFTEARRLLAAAGYPGGRGLPVFEAQTYTLSYQVRAMEAIQRMWQRELGVRVTIAPIEQKTLFQNEQSLNYAIAMSGWAGDYVDPSTFLNQFVTGGGNNWTGWRNPEYDRLIGESENTADNHRRYELFQQAEALLLEGSPITPLYFDSRIYLIHPALRGWTSSLLGFHRFRDAWLEN